MEVWEAPQQCRRPPGHRAGGRARAQSVRFQGKRPHTRTAAQWASLTGTGAPEPLDIPES